MPKDDGPSIKEFIQEYQAQQARFKQDVTKTILAGMIVGYALRRKS